MKKKLADPILVRVQQDDGRQQWQIIWHGHPYSFHNTYESAQAQMAQLTKVDEAHRRML